MDKSIRKNEICVIGMPRCDYVFSSTRNCFIAYGFDTSTLEMNILKNLLEERGLVAEEAGGALAPGQSAFCAKICSKIITSQFCIILLNNDVRKGVESPNANVNMEYGLMLGFNKYVIPFQREEQVLPFNVAGLDTVKYTNQNFHEKATAAIDQAILETTQEDILRDSSDQTLRLFLMERDLLISPVDNEGEKNIFNLGDSLGFNLLNSFSGEEYVFFGKFASLRAESIVWRLNKLNAVISGRRSSFPAKIKRGVATSQQLAYANKLFDTLQILVIAASDSDKEKVNKELEKKPLDHTVEVLTLDEVLNEVRFAST